MNISKPELLIPAGDIDCIRAAVQNGADSVYFGANLFSARASAKNFSLDELGDVIKYCKIRNVKTHLTLNTLITNNEFSNAYNVAKIAYNLGIDAIIVQDLGLAKSLIENFPDLDVHASTQMSVHNLEGVLELQKLGFKRVVLARELSIPEIEYIKNNSNIELEVFIHGALCISYSGQCLFSSLVGGRSGNRGKCAQVCRLPYELVENNSSEKSIDKGFLLSPRDLCSLELLPELVKLGITSFKIEGRMKSPDYVATVTRIYRKYINMALNSSNYSVEESDKKDLLQVFNRGGFSSGHLHQEENKNLIFKEKPNNMGIYLGNISNFNKDKGYITLQLNETISIGDTLAVEGEDGKYTVSELIKDNKNIKLGNIKDTVKLGRIKGNIKIGAKVYKLSSRSICDNAKITYLENSNLKKIPINISINLKENLPATIKIAVNKEPFYLHKHVEYISDIIPTTAIKQPLSKELVASQISKLGNTPYYIDKIEINMDNNLYLNVKELNELRRNAINLLENSVYLKRKPFKELKKVENINVNTLINDREISLLLESINLEYDYSKIDGLNNIYIPLKYFVNNKYSDILNMLSSKYNMYIYMPTIIKANYKNLLLNSLDEIIKNFKIKGFVISNIAGLKFLEKYVNKDFKIVANYTMNTFNSYTINSLKNIGITSITPSVELNKESLDCVINNTCLPIELIAYGRMILMNSAYCLLGKTNRCYPECDQKCSNNKEYYLKDRLGLKFRILPDKLQTVTSIYNSKITSIDTTKFNVQSVRINILDETIEQINKIISSVKSGKKLEGSEYTNGNLNREI